MPKIPPTCLLTLNPSKLNLSCSWDRCALNRHNCSINAFLYVCTIHTYHQYCFQINVSTRAIHMAEVSPTSGVSDFLLGIKYEKKNEHIHAYLNTKQNGLHYSWNNVELSRGKQNLESV